MSDDAEQPAVGPRTPAESWYPNLGGMTAHHEPRPPRLREDPYPLDGDIAALYAAKRAEILQQAEAVGVPLTGPALDHAVRGEATGPIVLDMAPAPWWARVASWAGEAIHRVAGALDRRQRGGNLPWPAKTRAEARRLSRPHHYGEHPDR